MAIKKRRHRIRCSRNYFHDSQECDGDAVHGQAIKQLPRPASGDAKIFLSDRSFLVYRDMTEI